MAVWDFHRNIQYCKDELHTILEVKLPSARRALRQLQEVYPPTIWYHAKKNLDIYGVHHTQILLDQTEQLYGGFWSAGLTVDESSKVVKQVKKLQDLLEQVEAVAIEANRACANVPKELKKFELFIVHLATRLSGPTTSIFCMAQIEALRIVADRIHDTLAGDLRTIDWIYIQKWLQETEKTRLALANRINHEAAVFSDAGEVATNSETATAEH